MLDGHTTEEASKADKSLDFYDIGIAEIVLMPSSNIVNRTVKEAGFRDKFNVNVLGIRRKKEYILRELGRERMHSGDVFAGAGCVAGHRTDKQGRFRLGGIGAAFGRSRQSDAGL